MPKKTRHNKEAEMYPVVKRFLNKQYDCNTVYADLPGDALKVRLRRNQKFREIDVVGIAKSNSSNPIVHLCEGKRFSKGESFENAIEQLSAVRESGDKLWVFVPKKQWEEDLDDEDRKLNRTRIKEHHFGLLLVDTDKRQCHEEVSAPSENPKMLPEKKNELLEMLEIEQEELPYFLPGILSKEEAGVAASTFGLIYDFIQNEVHETWNEVFKEQKKATLSLNWSQNWQRIRSSRISDSPPWLIIQTSLWWKDKIGIEGDPFGTYLGDGQPRIWVWCALLSKEIPEEIYQYFGEWYFYAENSKGEGNMQRARDIYDLSLWEKSGYVKEHYIGYSLNVIDRTSKGIQNELCLALKALKKYAAQ